MTVEITLTTAGTDTSLFDIYSELTAKADSILGYSIKELCLEDPEGNLANTLYTFPSTTASGSLKQIEEIAEAV